MADMIIFKSNNKLSVELKDVPVCVHLLQVAKHLTCINEKALPQISTETTNYEQ